MLFTEKARTIFVAILFSISQGIWFAAGTIISFIYKEDFHLQPAAATAIASYVRLPFTVKPIWGVLSDSYPLCGYKKKPYLVITAIFSFACMLNFSSSNLVPSIAIGIAFFFVNSICTSFQSVLAQAIIVERAKEIENKADSNEKEKTQAASNGMSIVVGFRLLGQVLLSTFIMFLFTKERRHDFMFFICMVPLALAFISFLLPEKRKITKKNPLLTNDQLGNPSLVISSENVVNIPQQNQQVEQPVQANGASNIKRALQFMKNPLVYKCWLLVFLSLLAPSSNELKVFYYDNYLHFDESFWGLVNNLAFIANMVGAITYNRFFSHTDLKKFYCIALFITMILQLSMLILYFRYTVAWGIPDKLFVALDTLLVAFNTELYQLPVFVLACRLCPKNIEATVFSIFMAAPNAAVFFSQQGGAWLLEILNISKDNFDNIWIFCIVNALFPLLSLALVFTIDEKKASQQVEEFNKQQENAKEDCETMTTPLQGQNLNQDTTIQEQNKIIP